jgi:uncharacterized protein YdeI (YjbR/CyaY-like superfamily)
MTHDPRIDDYIAKAAPFAQPILTHVRALVRRALPGAEEGIKWGMPHFMVGGKNAVGMAAFKAHAAIVLHGEDHAGEGMGSIGKLHCLADLPPDDALIARIEASCATLGAPGPKRPPKSDLPIPVDFEAALATAPAAKSAFETFAPSHRREYIEWITQAKRDETRANRISQSIEWLDKGRKRYWKYENC